MLQVRPLILVHLYELHAYNYTDLPVLRPCFHYVQFHFHVINISVECAHLKNTNYFLLKPNPYVEIFLDDNSVKKTEVVKGTYQPKWNEKFTM